MTCRDCNFKPDAGLETENGRPMERPFSQPWSGCHAARITFIAFSRAALLNTS